MRCLHWILPLVSILYFINRRTDSEKLRKLEKRMREPEPEQDFKPQLELLRTLMSRVTTDVQQIEILTNYLEDKLVKKRNERNLQLYHQKKCRYVKHFAEQTVVQ